MTAQAIFTATITSSDVDANDITIKVFDVDSIEATEGQDQVDTIWATTTAYTAYGDPEDGVQYDFDDQQWMADVEAALAADGWTVTDWLAEHGDHGAIVGATVVKA